MKVIVPPIKSQGIKTKLVPWIDNLVPDNFEGKWIEPFMGTGVVGFNIAASRNLTHLLMCDTNPHLINFYRAVQSEEITAVSVKHYLQKEGSLLLERGESHYYQIRERFNQSHDPLDFLFLSRAGFNGMMRFNQKGGFNIPFCKKPQRFAQAYITKIVNQVAAVSRILQTKKITFKCQSFEETIRTADANDLIYCDPPYIGRHVDYFNGWNEEQEISLFQQLSEGSSKFILSSWHHNDYRKNEYMEKLWNNFQILTREHFYHVGGHEKNRNPMIEAIVINYTITLANSQEQAQEQLALFGSMA